MEFTITDEQLNAVIKRTLTLCNCYNNLTLTIITAEDRLLSEDIRELYDVAIVQEKMSNRILEAFNILNLLGITDNLILPERDAEEKFLKKFTINGVEYKTNYYNEEYRNYRKED